MTSSKKKNDDARSNYATVRKLGDGRPRFVREVKHPVYPTRRLYLRARSHGDVRELEARRASTAYAPITPAGS